VSSDLRLVIFDLGRVLIRICDSWPHACEVAGVAMAPDVAARIKGPPPAAADDLLRSYDTGGLDLETFANQIAPLCGLAPRDVIRLQECYLRGPYAGIDPLLDDLAAAGVRTACLSNTSGLHWEMMQAEGGPNFLPLHRLDHRFASHLVRLRKPDEAIYEHVERETGLAGRQIAFFDDVQENVDAALRRGWRAHRIDPVPDDPIPQVRGFLTRLGLTLGPARR
jgi:putative hydrolase of the HAD superfamily